MSSFAGHKLWLVACVLITCYSRTGTRTVAATSDFDRGPLGILFPPNEQPSVVRFEQSARNARHVAEPLPQPAHEWQSTEPESDEETRSKGADDSNGYQDPNRKIVVYITRPLKEHRERAALEMILRELKGIIPGPANDSTRKQQAAADADATPTTPRPTRQPDQIRPLLRSGRMDPTSAESGSGSASGSGAAPRPASKPAPGAEPRARDTGDSADNAERARHLQVLEPADSIMAGKSAKHATGQRDELKSLITQDLKMLDQRPFQREGSREVAQEPHPAIFWNYGENKRVENSRGWNNLRGMWGKRSAPKNDATLADLLAIDNAEQAVRAM